LGENQREWLTHQPDALLTTHSMSTIGDYYEKLFKNKNLYHYFGIIQHPQHGGGQPEQFAIY